MSNLESATQQLCKELRLAPNRLAPEKKGQYKFAEFNEDEWDIEIIDGRPNFVAYVEDKKIKGTYSAVASIWCLSRISYYVFNIGSKAARDENNKGVDFVDITKDWNSKRLTEYKDFAFQLNTQDSDWPETLNQPAQNAPVHSEEWYINNICLGALGWVLLHEMGHIHNQDTAITSPDLLHQQEFNADKYATQKILENPDGNLQQNFRELSILLAFIWIIFKDNDPERSSSTHPSSKSRLRQILAMMGDDELSPSQELAAYAMKAIFYPTVETPAFDSPVDALDFVLGSL